MFAGCFAGFRASCLLVLLVLDLLAVVFVGLYVCWLRGFGVGFVGEAPIAGCLECWCFCV